MKKITAVLAFFMVFALSAQDSKRIFGKVSDGSNPMSNVNISVKDKDISTATDDEGAYEIYVAEGDKLEFSYAGMKTISIRIEDVTRVLNPIMVPDVTELKEVVVEGSKRRSQKDMEEDYTINKKIIRTAYGYLDADRASGNIRILSDDEINAVSLCVLGVLRNRFAGIEVIGDCLNGGAAYIRGSRRAGPMIWDVDGQVFIDAPIWLGVNNIKRMAILGNLATTVQYGNLGDAGVVVINTATGTNRNEKIVDRARLRNNYLTEKALTGAEVLQNMPNYQKELEAASSLSAAKEVFESNKLQYASSPYFFLDNYRHFTSKWNDDKYAKNIIQENFYLFEENAVLLKALAYSFEEQGHFDEANETYKEAFIQRPNYAQSYLDMANSYRNLNQHKQSAAMFARYGYLQEEGFMAVDTIGIGPIMNREFNNLLILESEAVVNKNKSKKLYVAEENFKGTRLVFEWNDGEAEFDLQFVNPGNQYHTWKHSLAENDTTIDLEKEFGYNVTEYLIDGSLPGEWSVNVNYLGNKSLTPTYLKATVYHNYGLKSQRKEIKVYKLSLKGVNQELFKLQIASSIKL